MATPKEPLPWFKFFAAEALSDSSFQGWTCEERGAWLTLVSVGWVEGSIPAGQPELARLLHLDAPTMRTVWEVIGSKFSPSPDAPGRLISPRQEKERESAYLKSEERSQSGTKGARSRWQSHGSAIAKPRHSHGTANAEPMAIDGDVDGRLEMVDQEGRKNLPSPTPSTAEGRLGQELKVRLEAGLGRGLIPLKNGQHAMLERILLADGGTDPAYAFIAATCREQNTEPKSMAWVVKVLSGEARQ